MSDSILWINHAGYELRTEGLRIVSDPWIEGLAFADSWAQTAKTRYTYEDFAGVDYIWFSHEHPDHFAPGNLRKIPEAIRKTITVLFARTRDGRVAAYCEKLGFKLREIADGERIALSDKVHFTLGSVNYDSWSFVETPERTYLNMNDCVPRLSWHAKLAKRLPRPVDVLLTQFSYASFVGNAGDAQSAGHAARYKFTQMRAQIEAYKPKILIPFASYVWFCRQENFHMNAGANTIAHAVETFARPGLDIVVLYPGDEYQTGRPHDSRDALARYAADAQSHAGPLPVPDAPVPADQLEQLDVEQRARIAAQNTLWPLRLAAMMGMLKPIRLHLTDLGRSLTYSVFDGLRWTDAPMEDCEIALSSTMLALMLQHGYGYGTVSISGRFVELKPGARAMLSRNFVAQRYNEMGYSFPSVFLQRDYIKAKFRSNFG